MTRIGSVHNILLHYQKYSEYNLQYTYFSKFLICDNNVLEHSGEKHNLKVSAFEGQY